MLVLISYSHEADRLSVRIVNHHSSGSLMSMTQIQPYADRHHAGKVLAEKLQHYQGCPEVLVLALPRGGVPVAVEVPQALEVPLAAFIVRKLGVPGQPELAFGAVAVGGVRVLNHALLDQLSISEKDVDAITAIEMREMKRRQEIYRQGRPIPKVAD